MKFVCLFFMLLPSFTFASSQTEEKIYEQFKLAFLTRHSEDIQTIQFTQFEQKLFLDAIEDVVSESGAEHFSSYLSGIDTMPFYGIVEKTRLEILKLKTKSSTTIADSVLIELLNELQKPEVEKRLIYIIAAHEKIILEAGHLNVLKLAQMHDSYYDISEDSEEEVLSEVVTDLFFNTPDVTTYMQGEYLKSVKIFMFCRQNRLYPCLMIMKDINGNEVRKSDGSLWSNPSLASARTGLPSYQRNGNTPAGIFTIDSVMPVADQQSSYGKFRRMILNFVPPSQGEVLMKSLLPKSSWDHAWWKPSTVARDIGRNLFRIHGSGKTNTEPATPYFPFMRTLGCIAQRENTYDGNTYKDQRDLLDSIMKSLELTPKYENEPLVKGILYILELNDKNAAVTLKDLEDFGIK